MKFFLQIQKVYRIYYLGIVSFKDFFIDVTCMTNLVNSIVVVVIKIPEYILQADGIHMLQLFLENRQQGKSEIFHGLKYTL